MVKYRKDVKRMRQIKWGVLGTANIAKGHTIPAMLKAENCRLYGIAGRSKEKAEEFKAQFGFEKAYYSYDDMLEDSEIEAVYIPLPNTLHKEWVLKAAAKKKHILCEKPLSGTENDVKEMIQACDTAGVYFMEAFAYLHTPIIKSVKEALDSGIIGKPSFMETTFLTPTPNKENIRMRRDSLGGALYDLGCYNVSLILAMLGEEPSVVKAIANFTDQNIDDFVTAYFEFPSGCRASIITGMCSEQRSDRYFIHGTEGTIEAPVPFNFEGTVKYYIHKNGGTKEIVVEVPNNYTLEVEQLGRCITEGEQPYVSHEFSMKNARTMDRVLESMGY
jgi:predicted dehydrogenase